MEPSRLLNLNCPAEIAVAANCTGLPAGLSNFLGKYPVLHSQAQHVLHIEQARLLRVSQPAARTAPLAKVMRLEALWVISTRSPLPANSHRVIADDIAGADGLEADGPALPLAGVPSRP